MSRVYFHSPSGEAKLAGSERAWLCHLAKGLAAAAWDLDGAAGSLERAVEIVSMVPEVEDGQHGANYLHTYMREAVAQEKRNDAAIKAHHLRAVTNYEPLERFVQALRTKLKVEGVPLRVAGLELHSRDVELNTALAAGSDPVRLAAKVHGWCETHCWVEGPDRAWMAGLIDRGLKAGLYRAGLWYEPAPGAEKKWSSQGWEEVTALLRARDDEPVVLSYSVCDQFPNPDVGWMPPWPEGVPRRWDALTEEQLQQRRQRDEEWADLDDAERWRIAMDGLRAERPWARLAPDTLADVTFGPPVTVYDLLAPDRDTRVRAAAEAETTKEDA